MDLNDGGGLSDHLQIGIQMLFSKKFLSFQLHFAKRNIFLCNLLTMD